MDKKEYISIFLIVSLICFLCLNKAEAGVSFEEDIENESTISEDSSGILKGDVNSDGLGIANKELNKSVPEQEVIDDMEEENFEEDEIINEIEQEEGVFEEEIIEDIDSEEVFEEEIMEDVDSEEEVFQEPEIPNHIIQPKQVELKEKVWPDIFSTEGL